MVAQGGMERLTLLPVVVAAQVLLVELMLAHHRVLGERVAVVLQAPFLGRLLLVVVAEVVARLLVRVGLLGLVVVELVPHLTLVIPPVR
jgi:hypothetical protein